MSGSKILVSSLFFGFVLFFSKILVESNELVLGNLVFTFDVQRNIKIENPTETIPSH